jgi:hypothetical protein
MSEDNLSMKGIATFIGAVSAIRRERVAKNKLADAIKTTKIAMEFLREFPKETDALMAETIALVNKKQEELNQAQSIMNIIKPFVQNCSMLHVIK